ncbi:hypothetical protein Pst134EA_024556 [Puccinia striiformis f. sp. tritici]|uniref:Uncharacterized protein n=2 Tax=Puccinia striiformis TaxID=27350 RepID=A0A0L0UTF0_9BASI|nr:hypothetical protein Pst134EA_024556 [Puccinia striiformis f. sp. tritici]KAH9453687.1 hypothetical protein Pst134EA_024556 [Puccinia striiformis f. sp. tritici]KNE89999.1 hypothetical protein PSTG_16550 [Puccinia striiformis f. sp. tritici PST-78]POW17105.1 hypothetical protein PSTT_00801 [Puccinia striiformis]
MDQIEALGPLQNNGLHYHLTLTTSPVPFARSVVDLLTIWPALQLSFEQSTSHQAPAAQHQARSELATELVGAFLDAQPTPGDPGQEASGNQRLIPEAEEIEDFLLGWMLGTLDVRIEDESEISVSRDLIRLWNEWSTMTSPANEEVVRSRGEVIQRVDRDDDQFHSEDDEDHTGVDRPAPQLSAARHQPSPTVDEDGFTLVTKSTQRH